MLNDVNTIDGPVEVRGQFIDIGRLAATDPRLGRYENKPRSGSLANAGRRAAAQRDERREG